MLYVGRFTNSRCTLTLRRAFYTLATPACIGSIMGCTVRFNAHPSPVQPVMSKAIAGQVLSQNIDAETGGSQPSYTANFIAPWISGGGNYQKSISTSTPHFKLTAEANGY